MTEVLFVSLPNPVPHRAQLAYEHDLNVDCFFFIVVVILFIYAYDLFQDRVGLRALDVYRADMLCGVVANTQ